MRRRDSLIGKISFLPFLRTFSLSFSLSSILCSSCGMRFYFLSRTSPPTSDLRAEWKTRVRPFHTAAARVGTNIILHAKFLGRRDSILIHRESGTYDAMILSKEPKSGGKIDQFCVWNITRYLCMRDILYKVFTFINGYFINILLKYTFC